MTCEIWREQIEPYIDGELAPSHESEVGRHLRTCAECTAHAAEAIHLKRAVAHQGKRYQPSAEFRDQIARSIGARKASSFVSLRSFAFAALVLIAVALGVLTYQRRDVSFDREIADIHLSTIASANPIDVVSTDQHTVKPWFQGKLPFSFNLPELANSPFTLAGGKLIYVRNKPTALLLFQYRLHKISVLIGSTSALGSGEETRTADGFHILRWTTGERSYVLVGDTSPDTLKDLAHRMKEAN